MTLGYAMDQGGGQVVWSYVLRFALAPIFYWLPAWLAVCLVYGFMQARQQGGGWLRWSARFLRRSWAWQGRGDTLFWLALMPWLTTLGFGATGVVELSKPTCPALSGITFLVRAIRTRAPWPQLLRPQSTLNQWR